MWLVWIGAALACLGSGIAVVSFSNAFFSALALIGNLGSLAVFYLLLSAEFVAAAHLLIYAGSVVIIFLFVLAYLGEDTETPWVGGPTWQAVAALIAAAAILLEVIMVIGLTAGDRLAEPAAIEEGFGGPAAIGRLLLSDHLLAFEVTSIVVLVAAVGGVVLGWHSRTPRTRDGQRR